MPDDNTNSERIVRGNAIPWKRIPPEVKQETHHLAEYTKDTGREGSITLCKKPNRERLFIGADFRGDSRSTFTLSCDARFGKSKKIGSVHSHPANVDTVGIVPSEGDLYANVGDGFDEKTQLIDCITAPGSPLINCYAFNKKPTRRDVTAYETAFENSQYSRKPDPFFVDNVEKDFDIRLFDTPTGRLENTPAPKKVIRAAFGQSNKVLRQKVKVFQRGTFCNYITDLMGQGHRDDVVAECKRELSRRSFLGLIDY